MKIAQVAPLFESVPPVLYGGTERIVAYLVDALVDMGHDVTLFASGDSCTRAKLVPICPRALRLDPQVRDRLAWQVLQLQAVARRGREFDCVHFHVDHLHFPLTRQIGWPSLTTLHGRLDLPELEPLYREYGDIPLVSISDAQRAPLPAVCWEATVHHGLPPAQYVPGRGEGGYLAFLGRISPEKRPDRAIEIATRAGVPLRIAAKVDAVDRDYFEQRIRPLLARPGVEFLGEIGDAEKPRFLGEARALLFPIDWPEPFGLVMIEALGCGTPVVAWPHGSVPEVLRDGRTGFLVRSVEEAVAAVGCLERISRVECRHEFEARFTARRMAADYVRVYERIASRRALALERRRLPAPRIAPLEGDETLHHGVAS